MVCIMHDELSAEADLDTLGHPQTPDFALSRCGRTSALQLAEHSNALSHVGSHLETVTGKNVKIKNMAWAQTYSRGHCPRLIRSW